MSIYYQSDLSELNGIERGIHLALRLMEGEEVTARSLSLDYGIHRWTAYRLLDTVSLFVPVDRDETTGVWRLIDDLKDEGT